MTYALFALFTIVLIVFALQTKRDLDEIAREQHERGEEIIRSIVGEDEYEAYTNKELNDDDDG